MANLLEILKNIPGIPEELRRKILPSLNDDLPPVTTGHLPPQRLKLPELDAPEGFEYLDYNSPERPRLPSLTAEDVELENTVLPALPSLVESNLRPSQVTQREILELQNRDYGIKRDEFGNVISRGKDRDKKWSLKDKIGSALLGALEGLGRGGLGGAVAGGVMAGTDRNFMEKRSDRLKLPQLIGEQEQQRKQEDFDVAQRYKEAQAANIEAMPEYRQQQQTLKERNLELAQEKASRQYEMQVKNYQRLLDREASRRDQSKVQEVDGYLFRTYPNDSSKQMEPIIDPRTGKQAFNPANVAQEITFSDGTKAYAKGGQIVQGKFASERQDDQQTFTSQENEKQRRFTLLRDQKAQEMRMEVERFKAAEARARQEIGINASAEARAQAEENRAKARQEMEESRKRLIQMQSDLRVMENDLKKK